MTRKDIKRLNRDAKKSSMRGRALSKNAIYKLSQQRRRSLY